VLAGADPLMRPSSIGGAGCITAANPGRQSSAFYRHPCRSRPQGEVGAGGHQVRAASARFVQIPAIKAMLARRYKDNAWRRVRPPLMALDTAEASALDRLMDEIG
jgi:4-hydroxy-tetrahydrodipicolinate synthase